MSSKMPMRQFLMFRELIERAADPTANVNALLSKNPDWDPQESRTWDAWKDADLPRLTVRSVDTASVNRDIL